jgi:hypothetical protein
MNDETETPTGKRTVRRTVRGSLIGYIGRVQWINFGEAFDPHAEQMAKDWVGEA